LRYFLTETIDEKEKIKVVHALTIVHSDGTPSVYTIEQLKVHEGSAKDI
jgi:hypothetical protein